MVGSAQSKRPPFVINACLTLSFFGWFGVTAGLFGRAGQSAFESVTGAATPEWTWTLAGGAVMVATTIFGFRAIDRLARVVVPLLAIMMLVGVYLVIKDASWSTLMAKPAEAKGPLSTIPGAMSVLIGSFMAGVTTAPDLARFLRAKASPALAASLGYGAGFTTVLFLAGLPALATGSADFIDNMLAIGLGVPALVVVIFATWTTNVNNLYSASLGLARIAPRVPDWLVTLSAGIAGLALALLGILDQFTTFLVALSIVIPPIAGVYVSRAFIVTRIAKDDAPQGRFKLGALSAWAAGVGVGALTQHTGLQLTTVPAIDGLVAASLAMVAICLVTLRRRAREARAD